MATFKKISKEGLIHKHIDTTDNEDHVANGHRLTQRCYHNHEFIDEHPSTCVSVGYDEYECIKCHSTHTEDYESKDADNHEGPEYWETTGDIDDKCEYEYCEACGRKTGNSHEHNWNFDAEWGGKDCKHTGYTAYYCSRCEQTKEEPNDIYGDHQWVLYDDGDNIYYICDVCGEPNFDMSVPDTGDCDCEHSWVSSEDSDGCSYEVCEWCGAERYD